MENQEQYTEYQMRLMNLAKHFAGKNIDVDNIDKELDKTEDFDDGDVYMQRQKQLEKDFYEKCREKGVLKEYGAAAVKAVAKENAVATMYIQGNAANERIKTVTRADLEEYTLKYCNGATNEWLNEQYRKFPVHVICMLNVIAFYKYYCEKYLTANKEYQKTMYKEGIDANYKNIKELLRKSEKFAQTKPEDRFIDLVLPQVVIDYANEFVEHYKDINNVKRGKRERKQYIEVIDCETNMIVHTFVLRSDILSTFGITKGRLAQVLKSAKENPLAKHSWKKVKYKDKKYWLCEKCIEI